MRSSAQAGQATDTRKNAAERLQDEFVKEVERQQQSQQSSSSLLVGDSGTPPPLEGGEKGEKEEEEEEETFYSIGAAGNASSSSGGGGGNDLGIVAYELVGAYEPLPGLPDVKFRRCVFLGGCLGVVGGLWGASSSSIK